MTFVVSLSRSAVRLGKLSLGGKTIETPTLVINTTRGCIPHLTPDVFKRTLSEKDFAGLFVSIEFLLEDNSILLKASPHSLGRLLGFGDDMPVILATNEPIYYQHDGVTMRNGQDWVSIMNTGGIGQLHVLKEAPILLNGKLMPALVISPTDHYQMKNARLKRIKKSTDNSNNYLKLLKTLDHKSLVCPSLILHGIGGEVEEKREQVKAEMHRRLTSCTSSSTPRLISLISNVKFEHCKEFPNTSVYCRGSLSPEEIVMRINEGIDLFDSSFATDASTKGLALNIAVPTGETTTLDLSLPEYFEDFTPLSKDCGCISCQGEDQTTRAYIHHLVKTEEMLAYSFLTSHNLWQLSHLLSCIRESMKVSLGEE